MLLSDTRLRWKGADWEMGEKLGYGRFAAVYRARCLAQPRADRPGVVAAKVSSLGGLSSWARAQLALEASIWSSLSHPHIVGFHASVSDGGRHVCLLEFCCGGELFDRIASAETFCEHSAAVYISQLLSALGFLHARQAEPQRSIAA